MNQTSQDDMLGLLRQSRDGLKRARSEHFDNIGRAIALGIGPSAIARAAGYTREYIAKIRDGKGPSS